MVGWLIFGAVRVRNEMRSVPHTLSAHTPGSHTLSAHTPSSRSYTSHSHIHQALAFSSAALLAYNVDLTRCNCCALKQTDACNEHAAINIRLERMGTFEEHEKNVLVERSSGRYWWNVLERTRTSARGEVQSRELNERENELVVSNARKRFGSRCVT